MRSRMDNISAGLDEECVRREGAPGHHPAFKLGYLQTLVAELIEGSAAEKRMARQHLKKIIGRGRCILNARELAARKGEVALV